LTVILSDIIPNLTELQKHIIRQRLGEGITIRAIANELNVSKNPVLRAKQKLQTFGNIVRRPGSGRPKVTTDNEDFEMINFLRLHPFQTAIRARQETNFPASLKTRRRIKKSEINNRCTANKIFLTAQNKQQSVMIAQEYNIHQNIWDEKTLQSSNIRRLRVYRPVGTRYREE
jgi:transposase